MSTYNKGYTPDPTPPAGLLHAIRNALRTGRQNALSRRDLLAIVTRTHPTDERKLRAAINFLRHQGELILSTGGENGGYWIAASPLEALEYIDFECLARARDLESQARAMRAQIDRTWPTPLQPPLL